MNIAKTAKKQPYMSIYRAKALEVAAQALESEIFRMRREAEQLRRDARADAKRRELQGIWKHVTALIERGMSEPDARKIVAQRLNLDRVTVDYWMERSGRQCAALKKWRRDRQIILMAHTRSNRDIAEVFGLHEVTVSKIIQTQLKARFRA